MNTLYPQTNCVRGWEVEGMEDGGALDPMCLYPSPSLSFHHFCSDQAHPTVLPAMLRASNLSLAK